MAPWTTRLFWMNRMNWFFQHECEYFIFCFSYFLNWSISDCSVPNNPLSEVPLSEIEKSWKKSWLPVCGYIGYSRERHIRDSEIQTEPGLHARCKSEASLLRVFSYHSIDGQLLASYVGKITSAYYHVEIHQSTRLKGAFLSVFLWDMFKYTKLYSVIKYLTRIKMLLACLYLKTFHHYIQLHLKRYQKPC